MHRLLVGWMLPGFVLLAGCAVAATPSAPSSSALSTTTPGSLPAAHGEQQPALAEGEVRLQRSPCFGRCAQYTVAIDATGAVLFDGGRNVMQPGVNHGVADPTALAQLRKLLAEPLVRRLKDVYVPGEPGCGLVTTDQPGTVIDWQIDGERHHLRHYLGCADAPRLLNDLGEAIDAAAGSAAWVRSGPAR